MQSRAHISAILGSFADLRAYSSACKHLTCIRLQAFRSILAGLLLALMDGDNGIGGV